MFRFVSLRMDSSSACKVEEISAEIERGAISTCTGHGMTIRSYYEVAFTQCFSLIGVCADELRTKVEHNLENSFGREADVLAVYVVACKLSLEDILPHT